MSGTYATRSLGFGRLLALFLLVPIVELALLVWVGERIGFWPTVGLIAATALLGSWLARREGLAALQRFQERMATGQLPGRELTDGLIILVSGALLLTPGILTDAVGFLGLFPLTRAWIRQHLETRVRGAIARGHGSVFVSRGPAQPPAPSSIEDAEIIEEA